MLKHFQSYQILIVAGLFFLYYGLTDWEPFIILYHGTALGLALSSFILALIQFNKKN